MACNAVKKRGIIENYGEYVYRWCIQDTHADYTAQFRMFYESCKADVHISELYSLCK